MSPPFENLPTVPVSQKKESVLALWRRIIFCHCHKHYLLPSHILMVMDECTLLPNGNRELTGILKPGSGKPLLKDGHNDTLINIYMCICVCICVKTQVHTKYFYLRNINYLDCILREMHFQKQLQVQLHLF